MKEFLGRETIAFRAVKELADGWYVNLGFGIPTLISEFTFPDKQIYFQGENGILGFGAIQTFAAAEGSAATKSPMSRRWRA